MALAILGVTGFTGRLVLDEARRAGLDVRLVGRRREALEELAKPGEEVRVADARSRRGGAAGVFAGATSSRRSPGRFSSSGSRRPRRRSRSGAHYLDTSGEQAWVRLLARRAPGGRPGAPAGVRLRLRPGRPCGAAGRRAGRGPARRDRRRLLGQGCRHEPGHAADDRSRAGPGAGRVGGRPPRPAPASARRRAPCASRSASARSSSGAGPSRSPFRATPRSATCARTSARRPFAAKAGGLGRLAAPFVRPGSRFGPAGPSQASRRKSRFAVVAEARGRAGEGRAVVVGSDLVRPDCPLIVPRRAGADGGRGARAGVLAPAEAFDARTLAGRLEPFLTIAD